MGPVLDLTSGGMWNIAQYLGRSGSYPAASGPGIPPLSRSAYRADQRGPEQVGSGHVSSISFLTAKEAASPGRGWRFCAGWAVSGKGQPAHHRVVPGHALVEAAVPRRPATARSVADIRISWSVAFPPWRSS